MLLELYVQETIRLAEKQSALLDLASKKLEQGEELSGLEINGVLHALQLLIENSIGKSKQVLKTKKLAVPTSAYDAFADLASCGYIAADELPEWNSIIGLRNAIVHEYMNIDISSVYDIVRNQNYKKLVTFLKRPI